MSSACAYRHRSKKFALKAVLNSQLKFNKIGTFAPHFISEESFGAEENFEALVS